MSQLSAMRSPADAAFPRARGSIRRTSHIDIQIDGRGLVLEGAARDLITGLDDVTVAGAAEVRAVVGVDGRLASLSTTPPRADAERMIGSVVGAGFRRSLQAALPDEMTATTPLALLLDDLPVAALISGYARLYSGDLPQESMAERPQEDICSGWRSNGTMMRSVRGGEGVPVTIGPRAPSIADERTRDPLGWHDMGSLAIGAMRRRRLVDIRPAADAWEIAAMFRDTHVGPDGDETILHEYVVDASVDADTGSFRSCAAVPRVLPWVECPVAAASADQLIGQPLTSVRRFVGAELRGTSTCTHLNDLLRSLGDVGALVALLSD